MPQSFLDKLKENNIDYSTDENILLKNSRDTSLFQKFPKVVIYPKSKNEIRLVCSLVNNSKNLSISCRSGGTDMSGGAVTDSVVLSFTKYLNKIISIEKEKKESVVEPGVFYRDFEKETLKHQLILPSYPASREICAIGGMVVNNSGGEKSLRFGKTINYIKGLECVLSNGEIVNFSPIKIKDLEARLSDLDLSKASREDKIYKEMYELLMNENNKNIINRNKPQVSKNSAGYYLWDVIYNINDEKVFDLSRLIVGSQGTLALVSKIHLSLEKIEKHSKLLLIFLKDLTDIKVARDIVMNYKPSSFESYDEHTFKVSMKFFPLLIRNIFIHKKNKGQKVNLFRLIFSFWKEAFLLLRFGIPKLVLLAEFEGDDDILLYDIVNKCEKDIRRTVSKVSTEIVKTEIEAEKYWIMRRESFNLLRNKVNGLHTAPFVDDIAVKGEDLSLFLSELVPILEKYKLFYTIAGHVGEGNIHIIPLMNFETEENKIKNIKIIKDASHEIYSLVKNYKGSITAEHNDGLIRTPFLNYMYDEEMLSLFKKVKAIFDPNNIFNPGKKVPLIEDVDIEFNRNISFLRKF